jgi:TonB family protein
MIRFLMLLAACCPNTFAQTPFDIERALSNTYKGKVVIVRGFYSDKKLKYDADGNAADAKPGWWSIHGSVQINRVAVDSREIRFYGDRVMYFPVDPKGPQFAKSGESVQLSIPFTTDYAKTLTRVFVSRDEDIPSMVPDYEKPTVSQVYGLPVPKEETPSDIRKVGGNVSAPKLIRQQDPAYSEVARLAKYQGIVVLYVVVNLSGEPEQIRVARALGAGLDDRAVEAIRTWRFKPCMENGTPVKCAVNIEMNFSLY